MANRHNRHRGTEMIFLQILTFLSPNHILSNKLAVMDSRLGKPAKRRGGIVAKHILRLPGA